MFAAASRKLHSSKLVSLANLAVAASEKTNTWTVHNETKSDENSERKKSLNPVIWKRAATTNFAEKLANEGNKISDHAS